jgi:hypothetical protein
MGDTGTTDNGTEYRAYARTKPYFPAGLLGSFPVRTGTLLADASEAQVSVSLVRDYGKETRDMTVSLAPSPEGESAVIVPLENVEMAELRAVQIEYGDPAPADADWVIQAIALQPESGQMQ